MPSPVRFAMVKRLLEGKGYSLVRVRGSHHIFEKPGHRLVVIPVHQHKVKHVYLKAAENAP